ncbi:hypothetical protein BGO17_03070 [Candidatus Saccharibacteria bacterium 49-20]|nr:MAG: hypothetical protein BGO17_03070 [Candidatus Saccharibacteria bacterium 49-20]
MNTKHTQRKPIQKRSTSKKVPLKKRVQSHAKHVLVPHKANEYRPHLIRAHGIIAVLIIALLAQVVYGFATTGHLSVLAKQSNIQTEELLADTNLEREKVGAGDLQINAQLSDAAFLKAQNMFTEQYWAHVSPSGTEPWKWFGDVGYNYSVAGENLAKNYPTSQATVTAWMNSATHRENLLKNDYVDVGFAVVDGELNGQKTTLVVALYGAPVAAVAASETRSLQPTFSASKVASETQNPLAYFGTILESLSPVTIGVLGLLAIVAIVGVVAHHHREKLPKALKKSWRLHHGMYTFLGMISLGVLIIIATGGGSI